MDNTLAAVWVCCWLSVIIMVTRILLGRWCKLHFDIGDGLTLLAIVVSLARISFTHVIVLWKTNNGLPDLDGQIDFSPHEIWQREMASKFTLVARCMYISLLWIQKYVLLHFYHGFVKDVQWGRQIIRVYVATFLVTFAACIISTFVECHPFDLYWKVQLIPSHCTRAIVQLFVVGALDILTTIMLIGLPIPVLLQVRLNWQKKVQLAFLFSVGISIVILTAVRLPRTYNDATSETVRITWTTGQLLAATFVANAPTLYAFRHRLRAKKEKKMPRKWSHSGPHIRGRRATLDDLEKSFPADEMMHGAIGLSMSQSSDPPPQEVSWSSKEMDGSGHALEISVTRADPADVDVGPKDEKSSEGK